MNPLLDQFIAARLYAITCPPTAGQGYDAMVENACAGGADIIQFRDMILTTQERYVIACRLRDICRRRKVLFIVNDQLDLALSVGADGAHLGQDDLPIAAAKALVSRSAQGPFLLGQSTHSLEQARQAQKEGADYIGIGPVFATPTKATYEAVGLSLVSQVTAQVRTPHVAIGGIDLTNVEQVLAAGAKRIAVVRAVCGSSDVETAARQMKALIGAARISD